MIFFDADDTLWDTDSVFLAAQLQLSKRLAESLFDDGTRFDIQLVRQLDQILALTHPDGLKYPIHLLCGALVESRDTADPWSAVSKSQYNGKTADKDICAEYYETISATPQLYPETNDALTYALAQGASLGVFTESSVLSVKKKLSRLALDERMFTMIGSGVKTIGAYAVRRMGLASRPVMIGDQVDKDYTYPRAAGWDAVWVQRKFAPFWTLAFEKPSPANNLMEAVHQAVHHLQTK